MVELKSALTVGVPADRILMTGPGKAPRSSLNSPRSMCGRLSASPSLSCGSSTRSRSEWREGGVTASPLVLHEIQKE